MPGSIVILSGEARWKWVHRVLRIPEQECEGEVQRISLVLGCKWSTFYKHNLNTSQNNTNIKSLIKWILLQRPSFKPFRSTTNRTNKTQITSTSHQLKSNTTFIILLIKHIFFRATPEPRTQAPYRTSCCDDSKTIIPTTITCYLLITTHFY